MTKNPKVIWRTVILLFVWSMARPLYVSADSASQPPTIASDSASTQPEPEVDFGEQGDVILQVYLRDILLTDAMFAIMRSGNIYLPLAEIAYLLDFPIIVDSEYGRATGWYLKPSNTFTLDRTKGLASAGGTDYNFGESDILADDIDLYVDSKMLQEWFPLFFDVSLSTQVLSIRSPEALPKELARERAGRNAESEVTYAASREFDVPGYRAIDWPELSVNLGGFYVPEEEIARYDYRVRAVGDFAFMNGSASFSGTQEEITGATITLGRKNPRGMLGPLRIADYEIGDTSQFLPSLLGNSLSGRGLRLGNTRLADQRDIDTIDLQGEQQADFEVELYVNDRLRAVDRNSSDTIYDFQDVRLQLGQNEIRLEFYGPQGQRHTESRRSFVGSSQGRAGKYTYEFALVEPGKRVFDLFEEIDAAELSDEERPIQLSSALSMSYGLTRQTGIALTIASLATNDNEIDNLATNNQSPNHTYVNTKLSTDVAGILLSTDVGIDPNGKVAAALAARSARGDYEIGMSHQLFERDYRTIDNIENEDTANLTKLATNLNLSRDFFSIPGGRISYGANATYSVDHSDNVVAGFGAQMDFLNAMFRGSWSHNYQRDLSLDKGNSIGQFSASLRSSEHTLWSLSSELDYSDREQRLINSGSLRLSRPVSENSNLSLSASRDLQEGSTGYSASWNRQSRHFRFDSTIAGTSSDDVSLRFGIDFAAKRYPGQWIPTIASSGGSASVAVIVFADDNNNGKHDTTEETVEGVRLTRNGLMSGAVTDNNGVALMTGLSDNTSVDISIIASDIKEPTLQFNDIKRGVLPRPGRVPFISIPLQRATDLEGTVRISGANPAPNVRMVLTPAGEGTGMEIYTEFDGYFYLAGVPMGVYNFGPDLEQLESAGLSSQPESKLLVLEDLDGFPEPVNFNLVRQADQNPEPTLQAALPSGDIVVESPDKAPSPSADAALDLPEKISSLSRDVALTQTNVTWFEAKLIDDRSVHSKNSHYDNPKLDGDKDGILNADDLCQYTSRATQVNEIGCEYVGEQLSGVAFAPGSASMTTRMAFRLNGLARELKANPSLKISIETHTDNKGYARDNMDLALRRARSILRYLSKTLKVPSSQLSGMAMGEAKPVASNKTTAGRRKNRRIVVKLAIIGN